MAVENGILSYNGSMTFRSQPESFHYVFIGRPIKNGSPICFPPLSPGRRGFRWRDGRRCDDEISKTPAILPEVKIATAGTTNRFNGTRTSAIANDCRSTVCGSVMIRMIARSKATVWR